MKTKKFLSTLVAVLTLAAAPLYTFAQTDAATDHEEDIVTASMTVNGKPATPQQKAVAKQMAKQGAQMAKKGAQMAINAVTNPSKAQQLGDELEQMGDELERMGDSLETLAEDTTFFYEGEDPDTVALDEDWEDFGDQLKEELGLNTWWGKLFGGGVGILMGIFGILIAILAIVLVFGLLTAPIWILALIIWLIVRSSRTKTAPQPTPTPAQGLAGQSNSGNPTTDGAQTSSSNYVQPYPDENMEMWKSGVMLSCVGVGLILLFLGLDMGAFWGVGALVVCVGVAKLVIASTTKKKHEHNNSYQVEEKQPTEQYNTTTQEYNKSEQ